MVKLLRWSIVAIILVLSASFTWENVAAQAPLDEEIFDETGHQVTGEFLELYRSVSDPLRIFGLPITDAFTDSITGLQIQYFEKARFELNPEAEPGKRIRVSDLGHLTYIPGPAISTQGLTDPCRTYDTTGFAVCFDFLSFFDRYGGVEQFGYPISGLEDRDGRIVQYFYKARLEWLPENNNGERVIVSDLGREYFFLRGENQKYLEANTNLQAKPTTAKRSDISITQLFKPEIAVAKANEGQEYFEETGHWVTGEFLNAYHKVSDPSRVYGLPITEAFIDSITGLQVQYFEKVRFELHPEAHPDLRVQLSDLGYLTYKPGSEIPYQGRTQPCRTYPETGYAICFDFLEFFDEFGGVAQFGYPISNLEDRDGRIVQYFYKARLEWRPEMPSGERVVVSDLGRRYFVIRGENQNRMRSYLGNNAPQVILGLQTRAYPLHAIVPQEGTQTIFVIVQDQNLRPVPGASVILTFNNPDGQAATHTLPVTDAAGITRFAFSYASEEYGLAKVWVTSVLNNLEQHTVTSFRIWR